jgi:hypothetical protein
VRVEIILVRVENTLCVQKIHSYVCSSQYACEHHTQEGFLHAECSFNTYDCHNHTLRVEITLVCVEITVVIVVITFVRVKITLRVEITFFL